MAAGIPVVLTSRCRSGGVGAGLRLPGRRPRPGRRPAPSWPGTLSGPKARVALALGLGAGLDRAALAELLDRADPVPRARDRADVAVQDR